MSLLSMSVSEGLLIVFSHPRGGTWLSNHQMCHNDCWFWRRLEGQNVVLTKKNKYGATVCHFFPVFKSSSSNQLLTKNVGVCYLFNGSMTMLTYKEFWDHIFRPENETELVYGKPLEKNVSEQSTRSGFWAGKGETKAAEVQLCWYVYLASHQHTDC